MSCAECATCRWWRMRRRECALPAGAAVRIERGERRCMDYEKAVGEDWHAMLYGNSDTRWNHN